MLLKHKILCLICLSFLSANAQIWPENEMYMVNKTLQFENETGTNYRNINFVVTPNRVSGEIINKQVTAMFLNDSLLSPLCKIDNNDSLLANILPRFPYVKVLAFAGTRHNVAFEKTIIDWYVPDTMHTIEFYSLENGERLFLENIMESDFWPRLRDSFIKADNQFLAHYNPAVGYFETEDLQSQSNKTKDIGQVKGMAQDFWFNTNGLHILYRNNLAVSNPFTGPDTVIHFSRKSLNLIPIKVRIFD